MPNNYYGWGNGYQGAQQPGNISFGPSYSQPTYAPQSSQMSPFQQIFVQGEAGAQAYPFPPNCNFMVLWEADPSLSRFYIKQLDQSGRPLPIESYDYAKHVEAPAVQQSDLTKFVTIDQLQEVLKTQTPHSNFVTQDELKDLIGKLSVGAQGRIVLNESGV